MRLVSVDTLKINERISVPIRSQAGHILLAANAIITERYITQLKKIGIKAVYVEDEFFEDAEVKHAIKPETKIYALKVVADALKAIEHKRGIDYPTLTKCSKAILDDMGNRIFEPISILDMFSIDDSRCHHAVNVAILVAAMSRFYTYEEAGGHRVVEDYVLAALLHDVFLPNMKADHDDKAHPEKLLSSLRANRHCSAKTYITCYMHHEQFDGGGFPQQKSGQEIYVGARLLAIADMYDSLINGYGKYKPMKEYQAYEYIVSQAGISIDPEVLPYFEKSIAIYPVGATVLLNTGQTAIVTGQNSLTSRPKVRLCKATKEECALIDLLSSTTVFIENVSL